MQRKAVINAIYQSSQDTRKLEDYLKMQPPRFVILGIDHDSYYVVVWATSQFSCPLNSLCLNSKLHTLTIFW
jgi:predicted class III extradiol MEMO1 family dioxygenase